MGVFIIFVFILSSLLVYITVRCDNTSGCSFTLALSNGAWCVYFLYVPSIGARGLFYGL